MTAVVLGVAGGSGSGKTSVVDKIVADVGAARVSVLRHDRYYHDLGHLPLDERRGVNVDHPSAFDDDLFVDHVQTLVRGASVDTPRYDYATFTRVDGRDRVEPSPVVLIEGILLFASPRIRDLVDVKVYVDADADLRLLRRLRRDVLHRGRSVEDVITQYERTVRPMHLEFVEPSKRWADVIVPRGVENVVGVDLVTTRVESLLR
ncbi:uridine kinase [Actinospongicola halichondriae]|uniref:uridine kinase n=1 Tax=Actinospongicola halichondriae TaxID=3236844 RepID=UPI003D3E010E